MQEQEAGVGEFLRRHRLERGWSFRDAAKRVGIFHSRVDEVENLLDARTGKRFQPSYKLLTKFAKGYELPLGELLRRAGYEIVGIELTREEQEFVEVLRGLDDVRRRQLVDFTKRVAAGTIEIPTSSTTPAG